MKKLLLSIVIFSFLFSCAGAERVDLSTLSFADLLSLRSALDAEIISRPEWKEVTVPAGTWTVGSDIPAGAYSARSATGELARLICTTPSGRQKESIWLSSNKVLGKILLEDGDTVELTDQVVFSPPLSIGF